MEEGHIGACVLQKGSTNTGVFARVTYERVSFAIQPSITWVGLCVSVGSYYLVDDVVEYYGNVTRC